MDLQEELAGIVTALDQGGVEYALVGGLAVAVWGAPRMTQDIDLLVQAADADRAVQVAKGCGFTFESFPMEFKDGMELRRVSKVVGQAHLFVDFILVNANLEAAWQSRRPVPYGGRALAVISRDALIKMKVAAGRPQDMLDVAALKETDR